jgi:hypothetical protein
MRLASYLGAPSALRELAHDGTGGVCVQPRARDRQIDAEASQWPNEASCVEALTPKPQRPHTRDAPLRVPQTPRTSQGSHPWGVAAAPERCEWESDAWTSMN